MKKKGFTLVELLAVIAILAILVIVAMPNVLGMFNQAKANSFVTEVQKYMDTAKTSFMQNAMLNGGKEVVFMKCHSEINTNCETTANYKVGKVGSVDELDMDGAPKNYLIWFNRNGGFERVIIYDNNFCYDNLNGATNSVVATAPSMDKSKVNVVDVREYMDADSLKLTAGGTTGADVVGCQTGDKAKVD